MRVSGRLCVAVLLDSTHQDAAEDGDLFGTEGFDDESAECWWPVKCSLLQTRRRFFGDSMNVCVCP